jgi:hypothetical protein
MHNPNWTPSIVPSERDHTVYLVADDFKSGRVWCETVYELTGLEKVIEDLLTGQYNNPSRVVAFNTAEHWSQDVSADVAHELRRATCRGEISRFSFRISPIATKADIGTCNCPFPFVSSDDGLPADRPLIETEASYRAAQRNDGLFGELVSHTCKGAPL